MKRKIFTSVTFLMVAVAFIACNNDEETVTPAISITPKTVSVVPAGKTVNVAVSSNVPYDVVISVDWVKKLTSSQSQLVELEVLENTGLTERNTAVIFQQTGGNAADTLQIIQGVSVEKARQADSLALVAFYDATNGDNWTNKTGWKTSIPINQWFGVKVRNNRVASLLMGNNNLNGSIPAEIGNLGMLDSLRITSNANLRGAIPASLGKLNNLTYLELSNLKFTGNIPQEWGNMSSLKKLLFNNNSEISGSIPASIGNWTNLTELSFTNIGFTGVIPEEIGNLKKLTTLTLIGSSITGAIPSSIGNMSKLERLAITSNKDLTGNIPASIGNLEKLGQLSLTNNALSGSIPAEIGNLKLLQYVYLQNNKLSGSIPAAIGNMTSIEVFYLSDNQLSGEVPGNILNNPKFIICPQNGEGFINKICLP